jgi:hypothetical protein
MLTNSALGIGQQKLNELRLSRQAPIAATAEAGPGADEPDGGDESSDNDSPRRPKRKRQRRTRRG